MLIPLPDPADRQSQLRALGAILDAQGARGILIRDVPDGLLVRARVFSDRVAGGTAPLERSFSGHEVSVAVEEAERLRDTSGRGGPIEHDLRLVGRLIDREGWTDVSVLQDGDAWVVRYRRPGTLLGAGVALDRPRLVALEAIRARRATVTEREPATHRVGACTRTIGGGGPDGPGVGAAHP